MSRAGPVLRCRDLVVELGDRRVLHGVTASFEPATVTALIGPNGAGKSTLLKALAGQIPAAAGEVMLADAPLTSRSAGERGRAIAYLPQQRSIAWPMPVRDIVALGRRPYGRTLLGLNAADEAAIDAAMRAVDVADLADRPATTLSGGEQARVLIARTLAQQAPILVADEPTSGLDPSHQLALAAVLRQRAASGGTIIVAVHDLSLAASIATTVLVLDGGRPVISASPRIALADDVLARVFAIEASMTEVGGVPLVVTRGPATERVGRRDESGRA